MSFIPYPYSFRLGNLMTWQKVDYDFKYHNLEYQTDIPVLVMSEGRSMLTADVQVSYLQQCWDPELGERHKEIPSFFKRLIL